MAKKVGEKKGIFCLETDQWFRQKDRHSIEPALRLVERCLGVPYEHRDVGTKGEFKFFLEKYAKGYKKHPILYLGFHGWHANEEDGLDDAYVQVGDGKQITLDQLEKWIDGGCDGRIVYFGACGVMKTHGNRLNRFVRNTGAVAVAGYRKEVEWLESAAFDILALGGLQSAAFTKPSINRFKKELKETAPGLYDNLGFHLVLKS